MLRTTFIRAARPATRSFSTSLRVMAEGDAGGIPAINKREKASEDMNIRQREMEKLQQMKKKLQDQHAQAAELEKSIKEMEGQDKK